MPEKQYSEDVAKLAKVLYRQTIPSFYEESWFECHWQVLDYHGKLPYFQIADYVLQHFKNRGTDEKEN